MFDTKHADKRALFSAAMIGSGVGVTLAAAYMAGGMMRTANDYAQAARLAQAAEGGYSDGALLKAAARTDAGQVDSGVLTLAARHDPAPAAVDTDLDRRSAALAARLEKTAQSQPQLLKTSLAVSGPAQPRLAPAAPYVATGALASSRELECLTQAVYYEARGETPAGQAAIAQVVLNRARSPSFPKSVCGVVFQGANGRGCQFSFACNGAMHGRRERAAWNRAHKVASRALAGFVMAEVGAATHFHTTQVNPRWGASLLRVGQIGVHVFYRPTRAPKGGYRVAKAEKAEERTYARLDPADDVRLTSATVAVPPPAVAEAFAKPVDAAPVADAAAGHAQDTSATAS